MRRLVLIAVVAALWAMSPTSVATTIHVPLDEPTIQAGIDAASVGDTVLVACGRYYVNRSGFSGELIA